MPDVTAKRIPSYRKHKATDQARVTLNGKTIYLGRFGSAESRNKYDQVIEEWLAQGRQVAPDSELTVSQLILSYWQHCKQHYRKQDGRPTSELPLVKLAMRPLRLLYGKTSAADFGPLALKAVRQRMIGSNLSRRVINAHIGRIKRMFKWAVANELVPSSLHHALQTVTGLQRWRSEARESEPVRPVPERFVDVVKPMVSAQVSALIDLQLLTAMRPGEAVIMRACDVEMSGKVWIYRPESHKTEHHGHQREIYLGPRAQDVIRPFLKTDLQAYLFSPRDAREDRYRLMRVNRKTPVQPSQVCRRKLGPRKVPGGRYTVDSYRRAIFQGCERAFPLPKHLQRKETETLMTWRARLSPEETAEIRAWRREHHWHPHQLRHNAATNLRREHGVELARIILGHASVLATQIYAEADRQQAMAVIGRVG